MRTHFTFRVDTWTPDGESIVEHVAGVEVYLLKNNVMAIGRGARGTYRISLKRLDVRSDGADRQPPGRQ
jgi:hypothetical protein